MDAPVDVASRIGAVLKAVSASEPGGATTTAVATRAGIARPTTHRLLGSLLSLGLVDRLPDGRWVLGPELYLLSIPAASRYDVTSVAQPFVRRLAVATGESAFFSARRGDETVCLLREDGSFPIRSHVLHEGIRFPLGVASAGLAILSHLPDAEADAYLAGADLTAYGASHSVASLRARMTETQEAGYAVNPGLLVEGSWGMGAAVFDRDERATWALSVTGVEQRFPADRRREIGRLMLLEAHRLTLALR